MQAFVYSTRYTFSDQLPDGFDANLPFTILFNRSEWMATRPFRAIKTYYCIDHQLTGIIAALCVEEEKDAAISLPNAPFASVEVFTQLDHQLLIDFLAWIASHYSALQIRHYPEIYARQLLDRCFESAGFVNTQTDIGHYLSLNSPFEQHLNSDEKRKLKRAIEAGVQIEWVESDQFREVFEFINQCRTERGHYLSLQWHDFEKQIKALPHHYFCLKATLNYETVAACIAVQTGNAVCYQFYAATALAYKKISPMVVCTKALYEFCLSRSLKFLDLGTSMLNNMPNQSLIYFKEALGGQPYLRKVFVKSKHPKIRENF